MALGLELEKNKMAKRGDADENVRTIKEAVRIEPLALEEEFVRIPADLAYFGEQYAQAKRTQLVAKHELEREESRLYITIREEAEEAKQKPTEATIRAKLVTNEEYHDAKMASIEAEVDSIRASNHLTALSAKRDALISLGANLRAEMGGNPSIRNAARGARDVSDSRDDD